MDIKEIAKEMTKEDFLNKIIINSEGDMIEFFKIKDCDENLSKYCPNIFGLENICGRKTNCKKCWKNAIKDIKFKGENEMEFNKSMLKDGMVVEDEFKLRYLVLNSLLIYPQGCKPLHDFNDDLTAVTYEEHDICKVYKSSLDGFNNMFDDYFLELIWERKEEDEERCITEVDYDKEYTLKEIFDFPEGTIFNILYSSYVIEKGVLYEICDNTHLKIEIGKYFLNCKFKIEKLPKEINYQKAFEEIINNKKEVFCIRNKSKTNYYPYDSEKIILNIKDIKEGKWFIFD